MVAQYLATLHHVLSVDRLERYRPQSGTDIEMITTYLWNIELSKALYHLLGNLEMAFRNTISHTLAAEFQRPDWYDQPNFLQKREANAIFNAKFDIQTERRQLTPGRMIAKQDFGFWTSLISKGYSVWTQNKEAAIKRAFPHAPASVQYRNRIFDHVNALRLVRNRISHHEPIFDTIPLQNGQRIPVIDVHRNIHSAIAWIDPHLDALVGACDTLPTIHAAGIAPLQPRVEAEIIRIYGYL